MKPIKVFYHGKRLKDIYPFATKWEVFKYKSFRLLRRVFIITFISAFMTGVAYTAYSIGARVNPITVYAEKIVEVPIEPDFPILEKIAKCESNNQHYKDGQVLLHANKDGSTDIGRYQINNIHSKQASAMGLDLTKEADNHAFALHLYKTKGTEPWYSSKACWNK